MRKRLKRWGRFKQLGLQYPHYLPPTNRRLASSKPITKTKNIGQLGQSFPEGVGKKPVNDRTTKRRHVQYDMPNHMLCLRQGFPSCHCTLVLGRSLSGLGSNRSAYFSDKEIGWSKYRTWRVRLMVGIV